MKTIRHFLLNLLLAVLGLCIPFNSTYAQDTSPPVVQSLTFTPASGNITNGPLTVTITATLTDDLSGVSDARVYFDSPSGSQSASADLASQETNYRVSGTATNGVYRTTMEIPRYAEAGDWRISAISIGDLAGNYQNYDAPIDVPLAIESGSQTTQTPVITSQPSAQGDISIGGQAFFSVSADGTGLNFQWYKDGKAISGAVGSSLSINPVTVANAGAYTCRISNSAGKVTTEAAILSVVDSSLLIYKVKATKTDNEGTTTKKSAAGGWLVLDRSGQQGAFIWTGKQGKQKTYMVERRADLATHSTGPVAKSTTLVVADQASGDHPDVEHNLVWLRGGDALVKLSALDQTFAPLVMAGTIGRLTLGDSPMIQTLAVSLVLDKPKSTMSRTNADDMEKAITRITEVLNAAGYLEL